MTSTMTPSRPLLYREALGQALRQRRHDLGLTLRAAAAASHMSLGYLSEVERGAKEPASEMVAAACAAVNWTVADALDEVVALLRSDPATVSLTLVAGTSEAA
jgi:transcriptional regulator with XRE-family HTH domain